MHRWVEHTAELELQVEAGTEEDVYREAAEALGGLLGSGEGPHRQHRDVVVRAADRGALLAEWLNELVFLAETERFVPERVVSLELEGPRLRATVEGRDGRPRQLVKAVTLHRLRLEREGVRWHGRVVLDV